MPTRKLRWLTGKQEDDEGEGEGLLPEDPRHKPLLGGDHENHDKGGGGGGGPSAVPVR